MNQGKKKLFFYCHSRGSGNSGVRAISLDSGSKVGMIKIKMENDGLKFKNIIKKLIVSVMLGVTKSIGYAPYKDNRTNENRIKGDK